MNTYLMQVTYYDPPSFYESDYPLDKLEEYQPEFSVGADEEFFIELRITMEAETFVEAVGLTLATLGEVLDMQPGSVCAHLV